MPVGMKVMKTVETCVCVCETWDFSADQRISAD